MIKFPVPIIDQKVGMNCYSTGFKGIGGMIKQKADEFLVSEIIDLAVFDDLSSVQDELHRYPLYILEKSNIDSNHAVSEIKRRSGIPLKVIGLKDAKANTKQYATTEQLKNIPREIRTDQLFLTLKGFSRKPLGKASLLGNEFIITINLRRLFVQAYQSYIFNLCLSKAILSGENLRKGKDGDLCFEIEGPLIFGKIRKFNLISDSESNVVPAIRLAGYSFQAGKGR